MVDKEFTVQDRLGTVIVTGRLLADQRFGSSGKPRWTDMALYRVTGTLHDWRLMLSCGGCSPPRMLVTSLETLSQAPITCGACEKPFAPDKDQTDKPFQYALEYLARSWVYHRATGSCAKSKHRFRTVGQVKQSDVRWENLIPCNRCNPEDLEYLSDDERIAEEREETYVYLCSDAADIIKRLYYRSGEISKLAVGLLHEAARNDRDIASALHGQRRIR